MAFLEGVCRLFLLLVIDDVVREQTCVNTTSESAVTGRRIGKNFFWLATSDAIGKAVIFITSVYLARTLGVENFGVFAFAQTITFYFWLAVDLGTNMYAIREIAKDKPNADQLVGPLFSIRLCAGFFAVTIYSLCLLLVDMEFLRKLTFLGCALYLASYAFYTDWALKGLEKVSYLASGTFVSSIVFLGGTFLLVRNSQDVAKASFMWSLSYLPGALLLLYFLQKRLGVRVKLNFDWRLWLRHIKGSIWFSVVTGMMVVYQNLPVLLLGALGSNYEVGIYSGAYRIILAAFGAAYLIYVASYPVLSDTYANNRKEFKRVFQKVVIVLLSLSSGASVICTFTAPQIVGLLLGDQYSESVRVFRILVWLLPLFFIRNLIWALLSLEKSFKEYIMISVFGAIALGIGGLWTVVQFGVVGVAVVFLAVEVLCVLSLLLSVKSIVGGR